MILLSTRSHEQCRQWVPQVQKLWRLWNFGATNKEKPPLVPSLFCHWLLFVAVFMPFVLVSLLPTEILAVVSLPYAKTSNKYPFFLHKIRVSHCFPSFKISELSQSFPLFFNFFWGSLFWREKGRRYWWRFEHEEYLFLSQI